MQDDFINTSSLSVAQKALDGQVFHPHCINAVKVPLMAATFAIAS